MSAAEPYSGEEDRPLRSFVVLMAAYAASVVAGGVLVRRRGGPPERLGADDLALVALAASATCRVGFLAYAGWPPGRTCPR